MRREAELWERQALIRARVVYADEDLAVAHRRGTASRGSGRRSHRCGRGMAEIAQSAQPRRDASCPARTAAASTSRPGAAASSTSSSSCRCCSCATAPRMPVGAQARDGRGHRGAARRRRCSDAAQADGAARATTASCAAWRPACASSATVPSRSSAPIRPRWRRWRCASATTATSPAAPARRLPPHARGGPRAVRALLRGERARPALTLAATADTNPAWKRANASGWTGRSSPGTTPRSTSSRTRSTTASGSSRAFAATSARTAARRSSACASTSSAWCSRATSSASSRPTAWTSSSRRCLETIRANELKACYIRPLVYVGDGEMGLGSAIGNPIHVSIAVWPWGSYLGDEGLANGIRVRTSSFQRMHVNTLMTKAKAVGHYVNSILASVEARRGGYDESLMLDVDGYVAEGCGENLFIVRDGAREDAADRDRARGHHARVGHRAAARATASTVVEERFTRDEIYIADEAFLTGTAAEITPMRALDDRAHRRGQAGAGHQAPAGRPTSRPSAGERAEYSALADVPLTATRGAAWSQIPSDGLRLRAAAAGRPNLPVRTGRSRAARGRAADRGQRRRLRRRRCSTGDWRRARVRPDPGARCSAARSGGCSRTSSCTAAPSTSRSTCSRCGCSAPSSHRAGARASSCAYYFVCAVGGGILFTLVRLGTWIPSVGASGAIYGILMAYAMWFPNRQVYLYFVLPIRVRYLIVFLILLETLQAIESDGDRHRARRASRRHGFRLRVSALERSAAGFDPLSPLQRCETVEEANGSAGGFAVACAIAAGTTRHAALTRSDRRPSTKCGDQTQRGRSFALPTPLRWSWSVLAGRSCIGRVALSGFWEKPSDEHEAGHDQCRFEHCWSPLEAPQPRRVAFVLKRSVPPSRDFT